MGLFGKDKKERLPLLWEANFDEIANFSAAMAFLEGLSAEEYAKVLEVASIRRKANQDEAAALGMTNEPTTFINPPEPDITADEPDFLDDMESKPGKKIKVQ